jgi:hypothetical protein
MQNEDDKSKDPKARKTMSGASAAQGPKVKDALGYLKKVQTRFQDEPAVYNQFLEIMKEFKSQSIDTEGVIRRVKTLFKGNRNLILGFNQFLPPGYKIELTEPDKPALEFGHAVQYVAKIKERFKESPKTYAEFLEILHEYQSKCTIEEVYERVQKLFFNEEDLLKEFQYFLPESGNPNPFGFPGAPPAKKAKASKKGTQSESEPPQVKRKEKSKGNKNKTTQKSGGASHEDAASEPYVHVPPASEKDFKQFEKIKDKLTPVLWNQLLRALHLFSRNIVNRTEMVSIVDDLLGPNVDVLEKFKSLIDFNTFSQNKSDERNSYYTFVHSNDNDLTSASKATPSYRVLPANISIPPSSGRSRLCEEVLNDRVVSIPTGSEDKSFKATRKNVYEENLFKCEDERFEIDMLIERNHAAIEALKAANEKIQDLTTEQEKKSYRISPPLDILTLQAISRIYEQHGNDILQYLRDYPEQAVPIVLARLQQKDEEWRRVKSEMRSAWRKVIQQNYHRSLDHRSFYFKQEDKKRRAPKQLVSDLRELHLALFCSPATFPPYLPPSADLPPSKTPSDLPSKGKGFGCVGSMSNLSALANTEAIKTDKDPNLSSRENSGFLQPPDGSRPARQFPSSTLSIPSFGGLSRDPSASSANLENKSPLVKPLGAGAGEAKAVSSLSLQLPALGAGANLGNLPTLSQAPSFNVPASYNNDDSLWQSVSTAAGHSVPRPARQTMPGDPLFAYKYGHSFNFADLDTHRLLLQVSNAIIPFVYIVVSADYSPANVHTMFNLF